MSPTSAPTTHSVYHISSNAVGETLAAVLIVLIAIIVVVVLVALCVLYHRHDHLEKPARVGEWREYANGNDFQATSDV